MKKLTEYLTEMVKKMMDCIQISNYSQDSKNLPKAYDPTTVVLDNSKDPPLEGGKSKNIGGI